jgi:hypothetical protein
VDPSHRNGQQKRVFVYRPVTRGSIEERALTGRDHHRSPRGAMPKSSRS